MPKKLTITVREGKKNTNKIRLLGPFSMNKLLEEIFDEQNVVFVFRVGVDMQRTFRPGN